LASFAISAEASIVLKVIAVNPSKTEKQNVAVKAYLPKELKPENIIDSGGLEVAYDNQQGSYFAYGEYELRPGGVKELEIEMSDIWVIPAGEIESLRLEADKTTKLLENTDFRERINFLKQSIDSKLNEIEQRQSVSSVNPEKHISDYRDNVRLLESVKADLVVARSLLAQAKPIPPMSVWKLIIIIVIFLGVIGASSYFIWQAQTKIMASPTFGREAKEEPFSSGEGKRETKEEEK